jgi:hypothetical protein
MKTGLGFRNRLRGDLGPVGQEIDLTHQALAEWREGEHDIDGAHTDITADTIDVDGATQFGGPWTMPTGAVITPPQITADQNDYRPRFLEQALWLRLSTDASRTLTGLHRSLESGLDAFRWLCIANVGNFDIVLSHSDSASISRNRFACPGSADLTVQTGECVWLWYDTSSANWRVVAGSGAASGGGVVGALADADYGDVTVSGGGTTMTIDNDVVTFAKMQNVSAADRLLGRGNGGGSGDTQEIALGTNLSMSGTTLNASGGSLADGDYGDVTVSSSGTAIAIDADVVTYAKMQNISATQRVLGRNTSGAGDTEEVTLTQLLDWSGE